MACTILGHVGNSSEQFLKGTARMVMGPCRKFLQWSWQPHSGENVGIIALRSPSPPSTIGRGWLYVWYYFGTVTRSHQKGPDGCCPWLGWGTWTVTRSYLARPMRSRPCLQSTGLGPPTPSAAGPGAIAAAGSDSRAVPPR